MTIMTWTHLFYDEYYNLFGIFGGNAKSKISGWYDNNDEKASLKEWNSGKDNFKWFGVIF